MNNRQLIDLLEKAVKETLSNLSEMTDNEVEAKAYYWGEYDTLVWLIETVKKQPEQK